MPRWLTALIIILIIAVFIVPDPSGTGTLVGNFIESVITFFRSVGVSIQN